MHILMLMSGTSGSILMYMFKDVSLNLGKRSCDFSSVTNAKDWFELEARVRTICFYTVGKLLISS